jgi:hydroxymethylpyrimidine kinase/phosphomethylpyrimidine kinase
MGNASQKVCLTIAGLDPSGGAGIIADLKTFAAFGCYGAAAVTSITYQNTVGVFGAFAESGERVRGQVEPILDDFEVDALKTGMLPSAEVIGEVADLIRSRGLRNVVVDPVVRSTSGFDLIDDEALRSLVEVLFPLAVLITPNLPETERITGLSVGSVDDVRKAADVLRKMGARDVLIKGGHAFHDGEVSGRRSADDFLFIGGAEVVISGDYIDTTATHGTGCTLSAAIAAGLAEGLELETAVRAAKKYVTEAIRTAPMLGNGHSPVNHLVQVDGRR